MKRKVIQIAGSTQLVSLPREWALAQGIKKGEELDVEVQGDKIIVHSSSQKEPPMERAEFDISGLSTIAKMILGALYKGGYDEIRLNFSSPEELHSVQDVIRNCCVGFEVVDQGKNFIVTRKISDAIYKEFDSVLRRMFLFLKTIATESLDAAKNRDVNGLQSIVGMDTNLNKSSSFCRRVLNKRGHSVFKKTAPIYFIADQLEEIGDDYKEICRAIISNPIKLGDALLDLYQTINAFFDKFTELFYKFSYEKLREFMGAASIVNSKLKDLTLTAPKKDREVFMLLNSIAKKIEGMDGAAILVNFP